MSQVWNRDELNEKEEKLFISHCILCSTTPWKLGIEIHWNGRFFLGEWEMGFSNLLLSIFITTSAWIWEMRFLKVFAERCELNRYFWGNFRLFQSLFCIATKICLSSRYFSLRNDGTGPTYQSNHGINLSQPSTFSIPSITTTNL